MNNSIALRKPSNEPVLSYAPGTEERRELEEKLDRIFNEQIEIPLIIDGKEVRTERTAECIVPHDNKHVLAKYHLAGEKEVLMAIDAAMAAKERWEQLPWEHRASVFLKAAQLLSGSWRSTLNAATMLGQSKTAREAEIDSACELIDFFRFNVYYLSEIYQEQPKSTNDAFNRIEYRGLDGFVCAITPFNFTAIGGNLATAPAMAGNVVLWKPAGEAVYSNYYVMKLLQEAGLPDGVINFIPGIAQEVGEVLFSHEDFAGLNFVGSTAVFSLLWKKAASNLTKYRTYPRIVGETGGKDFVFAHSSADVQALATALMRGAFEYQGQKCSAASRAYIPATIWDDLKARLLEQLPSLRMGDVRDFSNFMGAVISRKAFDKIASYIEYVRNSKDAEILYGGKYDDSKGFLVEPTVVLTRDPQFKTMKEEIFGPVLTIYVYDNHKFEETLRICDKTSPYGLTGAIFARDRNAIAEMERILSYAAGNFYINDKPSGAVVGQQPFGGGRASGTNDKAGGLFYMTRWMNPRVIKENYVPPRDCGYPFMKRDH